MVKHRLRLPEASFFALSHYSSIVKAHSPGSRCEGTKGMLLTNSNHHFIPLKLLRGQERKEEGYD
jgi:hypothetical protein